MLTGDSAYLYYNSSLVGAVKSIQQNIDIEALPTTKQGATDKTYRKGLRNTTIKATLYYDPYDSTAIGIINNAYSDDTSTTQVTLVIAKDENMYVSYDSLITNLGLSMSFGSAHIVEISLQVVGAAAEYQISPTDPTGYNYS